MNFPELFRKSILLTQIDEKTNLLVLYYVTIKRKKPESIKMKGRKNRVRALKMFISLRNELKNKVGYEKQCLFWSL